MAPGSKLRSNKLTNRLPTIFPRENWITRHSSRNKYLLITAHTDQTKSTFVSPSRQGVVGDLAVKYSEWQDRHRAPESVAVALTHCVNVTQGWAHLSTCGLAESRLILVRFLKVDKGYHGAYRKQLGQNYNTKI